jgi:peptidoglycan/LPS O-acetylase OafA/YrhL
LAALYVVLFHIREQYNPTGPLHAFATRSWTLATSWLGQGHLAVDIFIVLSGFCLMMPVASADDRELRGGVGSFLKRRARRILPPYYAALALSFLPLIAAHFVGGGRLESAGWRYNFTALPMVSHLLLIHNLTPLTNTLYDPPMWSVATEWQIYFIFPLLLALRKKAGIWVTTVSALLVGLVPHFALPNYSFDWASPWFLGLFAIGMLAACISLATGEKMKSLMVSAPWGSISLVMFLPGLALGNRATDATSWMADLLVGAATGCLLISCARFALRLGAPSGNPARGNVIFQLLSAKLPVRLGVFSYSLYLIHSLYIIYFARLIQTHAIHTLARPPIFFAISTLMSVAVSYLFFLAIERRFLPGHLHTAKRDIEATILSPAP